MENGLVRNVYAMGPRVPLVKARDTAGTMTSTLGFKVPSRVVAARAETTSECTDARMCEKPAASKSLTLPIVLGLCIPIVAAISVLLYLHRRNVKKQRAEDLHDPHKSLDFGLDGRAAKGSRKSLISREKDGQPRFNRQQMSMDMNLSSPYLLPPEAHNSRESLNSLARSLHQNEDPYRPVMQNGGSEVGSIRSFNRGPDGASVYTRSSSRPDIAPLRSPGPYGSPSRQNSYPKSPLMPPEPSHMKPEQPYPEEVTMPSSGPPPTGPLPPIGTAMSVSPRDQDERLAIGTAIQEPPAIAQKSVGKPLPSPSQASPVESEMTVEYGDIGNPFEKPMAQELGTPTEVASVDHGFNAQADHQRASIRTSTSSFNSQPTSPAPRGGQPASTAAPIIEEPEPLDYYDFDFAEMPEMPQDRRSPSPANHDGQLDVDEPRGRNMQRASHLFEQQDAARRSGLGVPHQENHRLSVGFRPLPPDEIMESEDPEFRANRIRSFYKEYFEDTKPEDRPPMPPMPPQQRQHHSQQHHQHHQSNTSYYEDYDANYAQDAPYFDPASNSFVMPYAQPVSRRAMTPPPSGQRFPGPRGPPRAFHGSQAGMGFPPNMRGPPRPGSSVSNQMRGPPRPGSSVSNQMRGASRPGSSASGAYPRPRAGSAMSGSRAGSRFGGPRKPMPPPADLTTLPTPSKLTDDSFGMINAADFAPPETYADRARGRSQSPAGERRPYKMNVPVHSPLVNAFDELPALPSPAMLQKASTFTGLDFAPPRKFADSDNRSDAGSIRSNRSGLSAAQANAIRSGAGRLSRLPGDQVFTQGSMDKSLKPSWGMRD
ncbi:hypothetical protein C8A00DRAFT_29608 [Chaetomidium leptoderma]|uniref:Uncharacterized protein n=1 Tax=Chaetomidium leptoderma TaxID=669021 RepID=A0AAN6ZZ77_9PEZI|nr:hypothetical protein C8A00DRAFT_29608 [Chaetomidium leptoderma]